jgi:transcription termination/antitermination protein NusA
MGSIYQSIELLSKEKGIETQIVLDAVKHALLVVARKYYHTDEHYIAELNEKTGSIRLPGVEFGTAPPGQPGPIYRMERRSATA